MSALQRASLVLASLVAAALQAAVPGVARAQLPATPRALGMGGAYLTVARGVEALSNNPANLALPGAPPWSFSLPQLAASGTLVGARFGEVPTLFGDDAGPRRDEILDALPTWGAEARYDVRAPLGALQIGPFAVGVSYASMGSHSVGRDIVELLVKGYEESRTDYSVGNTSGSRATYYDLAASYGRELRGVSLGVTGHYFRGGSLVRSQMFEPRIDVEARDVSVDYLSVLSRGGSGYALDLGAAYQPSERVTLGVTLKNLAGRMTWSEDLSYRDFRVSREELGDLDLASLHDRYVASETTLDPTSVPLHAYETAQGLYDDAFFPTVARLGADWRPTTATTIGTIYESHLGSGYLAGRWDSTLGVGLQQKLGFAALRAGYASNLGGGAMVTGGLSLGPLDMGVARLSESGEDGVEGDGWAVTVGISVRGR